VPLEDVADLEDEVVTGEGEVEEEVEIEEDEVVEGVVDEVRFN
jgi:hypothetical protein